MLKPYKMDNLYIVADPENIQERMTTNVRGTCAWKLIQNTVWCDDMWQPEETDYALFKKGAREVAWLEVLVVIGQSKRQTLWEFNACFGVPEFNEE